MMDTNRIPVAIVGGGPVGLALALMLDRHGVRSVLFNSETDTRWQPKGSTQNARTMEHYRRLGFAHELRKLGLPADHSGDVAYFTRFNAYELARLRMPTAAEKAQAVATAGKLDQFPEPLLRANQMYVEAFLLDEVRKRGTIALRFGCEVTAFAQGPDGVTIDALDLANGQQEQWRAQYLIGCDGGRSFVRKALGIRYAGEETLQQAYFGGRMFASYVRAPSLYRDVLKGRAAFQHWAINPDIRSTIIALNGTDEFLFWMRPKDPQAEPDDTIVRRAFAACCGVDVPVEPIAHAPWTAGVALVAEHFAENRVLLAGDAVHLFTPTGGFGMNTGIDDAANLAWKLSAVIQGWGGPQLLATYQIERLPIAIRNTGAARLLAKNIGEIDVSPALEADGAAGDAARRKAGAYLSTFGEEFASIGVQLGARYDGSPVIASDEAPPPDDFVRYVPSAVPGGRAPYAWLGAGRRIGDSLFDRLGIGFTLLRLGAHAPDAAAFEAAAHRLNIPFKQLDIADDDIRALYGRDLVLIRPDQHVAWRGNTVPADAGALLRRLTGFG
jgi:2-polyprenyl-6-methoxyphenol hydroxylase-like FAD-dependent oxidoreductase